MFHRFHDKQKYLGSISSDNLEDLILNIGESRILSPLEWKDRCKKHKLENHHVCLTFDDCLKSQYEIALPILEKYSIKAFFFIQTVVLDGGLDYNEYFLQKINSQYDNFDTFFNSFEKHITVDNDIFLDNKYIIYKNDLLDKFSLYSESEIRYRYLRNRIFSFDDFNNELARFFSLDENEHDKCEDIWMTKQDIKQLVNLGHTIGLHTHNHNINFTQLSKELKFNEYTVNKEKIENITDEKVWVSSHPLGLYDSDTIDILKSLDIECSFRSNNLIPEGKKIINPSNFEFARNDVANILKP